MAVGETLTSQLRLEIAQTLLSSEAMADYTSSRPGKVNSTWTLPWLSKGRNLS